MEPNEAPTPFKILNNQEKLIQSKIFELKCEEQNYCLLLEIYSDNNIYFKLRESNKLSLYYYLNKYNYEDITKYFLLQKEHYTDLKKVFNFFDLALSKKKINLELDKKKKVMILKLKKIIDFDEIECKIELKETKIQSDEMFNLLIDEINDIKSNKKENKEDNNIISELINKNKENENHIKTLEDKLKQFEDELKIYKEYINEINQKFNISKNNNIIIDNNDINKDSLNEENIDLKDKNEIQRMNIIDISKYIKEFESIKTNLINENGKHLILTSENNQGRDIISYLLNKSNMKFIELIPSQLPEDILNEKYYEIVLEKIKSIMKTDNILILKDFDNSLYNLFNNKFLLKDNKKYFEADFNSKKTFTEVHKNFHIIIVKNNIEKLDTFKDNFEILTINFDTFFEKKDLIIIEKLLKFFDSISSLNKNNKIKIGINHLLINSQKDDIKGLIFKIKNDMIIQNNSDKNHWIFKEGKDYENQMLKYVLMKIVPLFPEEIISLLIYFDKNEKENKLITNMIIDIYNELHFYNFESYFKQLKSKRIIIYTFSNEIQNLFKEKKIMENQFGKYGEQSILFLSVQSFLKENDLITELKSFSDSKTKQMLIISFTESDLKYIYSVYLIIDNFEKNNSNLKEKIITFIINKKKKNNEDIKEKEDLISFLNNNYIQLFIDDLKGKDNSNIFNIIIAKSNNNKDWKREYLISSNFIEENIFNVLSDLKYIFVYETKELNKNNFKEQISGCISKNNEINNLILNNLLIQGKNFEPIIDSILEDKRENINNFFQIVKEHFENNFSKYLFNIINYFLRNNMLLGIINNFESIRDNEYINNKIKKALNDNFRKNTFKKGPHIIYNLKIPFIKTNLERLKRYIKDFISERYLKTERELRKNLTKDDISERTINYYREINLYKDNIKNEIIKDELFKNLFENKNNNSNQLLIEDYLVYFIISCFEKDNINCEIGEKLLSFLKFIIKLRLVNNKPSYIFYNSLDEFIKIILFTQGYFEDIKNILKIFLGISKYCDNLEERMIKILDENIIKINTSPLNQKYTEIVNGNFYFLIEVFIRNILIIS